MLRAKGLFKKYRRRQVLRGFSVHAPAGRIIGLLGPNGAGKSTALKIMAGYVRANEGRVLLDGEDISRLPPWKRVRKGLAYLPQENTIFGDLTVEENILAARPRNAAKSVGDIISLAGLEEVANTRGRFLSGGERRRTEIARLLALPGVRALMLDEPFAALDPVAVSGIKRLLISLAKEHGMAIILADHSVRDVMSMSDECVLMHRGGISVVAPPMTLARDPWARDTYLGPDFVAPRRTRATGGTRGGDKRKNVVMLRDYKGKTRKGAKGRTKGSSFFG